MRRVFQWMITATLATAAASVMLAQQTGMKGPSTSMPATADREVVTGIGGVFFRAHDPKMLAAWYQQHLGISPTPKGEGQQPWKQEAGATAFEPFPEKSTYFEIDKPLMMNFRVRNLDRMVAQLRADGIQVKDPENYPPIGRFTRLHDPEGNPIELWQPADPNSH